MKQESIINTRQHRNNEENKYISHIIYHRCSNLSNNTHFMYSEFTRKERGTWLLEIAKMHAHIYRMHTKMYPFILQFAWINLVFLYWEIMKKQGLSRQPAMKIRILSRHMQQQKPKTWQHPSTHLFQNWEKYYRI
jgi:hypothetical protein